MAGTITEAGVSFLQARGLDVELAARLGVESTKRGGGEWLSIPFYRDGEIVNHKYRSLSDKRFTQDPDAAKTFWNVDVLTDAALADQPLIITEGEFDAMAVIQAGFQRAISVPDGAPNASIRDDQSTKYDFIPPVLDALRSVETVILAVDDDPNGNHLLADLALRIGRVRCKWVRYPLGRDRKTKLKDMNDVLREYGTRGVVETIQRARWMAIEGTYRMSELPAEPEPDPRKINMPGFEEAWKPREGDFIVLTGIPGSGKSTLLTDVCCRLTESYPSWHTTFASFEQHPRHDHRRTLQTWFAKKKPEYQSAEELAAANDWIDDRFRFVWPKEDEDVTLDWLLERMANDVTRHSTKLCVIDPWNEMDHDRPPDMSATDYVGFAIRQLRRFARKYRVVMIVAAHPTKMGKDKDGKIIMPSLYDISDSAHWANKADVGIIVHRGSNGALVRVAKARYEGINGRPGDYPAQFLPDMARFQIIDEG